MTHEESSKTLTPVQRRFVREYPACGFNGAEAYFRASGRCKSKKIAGVQAAKLMQLPKIKEAIQAFIEEALGPQEKQMVQNVKFWEALRDDPEAKHAERLRASENLAKYAQMFTEKVDHNHNHKVQIVDDIK